MRLCAGCRQMKPKSTLLRVALTADGACYDPTGRGEGRGVYVCCAPECVAKLQKSRKSRMSGGNSIPDSVFSQLMERAENKYD